MFWGRLSDEEGDDDCDWDDRVRHPLVEMINGLGESSAGSPALAGTLRAVGFTDTPTASPGGVALADASTLDPTVPLSSMFQSDIVTSLASAKPHLASDTVCMEAAVFLPPPLLDELQRRGSPNEFVIREVPEVWEIHCAIGKAMEGHQLPREAPVLCCLYVDRWARASGLRLIPDNAVVVTMAALALAAEACDGQYRSLNSLVPLLPARQAREAECLFARHLGAGVQLRADDIGGAYFALRMLAGRALSVPALASEQSEALVGGAGTCAHVAVAPWKLPLDSRRTLGGRVEAVSARKVACI